MNPRFVLTGGPGSGKSTLIAALREAGHAVTEEAGRAIIREEVARGGDALPWGDRAAYARRMLAYDVAAWRAAEGQTGPAFFDRGIPDIRGYLRLSNETPLPEVEAAIAMHVYARTVFVAPPWEAIFGQDAERTQDFAEAVRTHDVMVEVYSALDYRLVPLPLAPVSQRLDFVRRAIGLSVA